MGTWGLEVCWGRRVIIDGPQTSKPSPPLTPTQAFNDLTFTEEVDVKEMEDALKERDYIFGNYLERLWAYLTIEQLLEKR